MIFQRNTIQIFVFICIPLFFMGFHIQTALASDSEGRGWCCRGGELFQSSPEECETGRGRFFVNRSEAARVCKPEKTETEGWCCNGREVFRTVREDCQRRRGHYFRNERDAHRYCEAQRRGWCCKDGKIFITTLNDCERKRGHFSMEKNETQAVCKETSIGWCCNKGELYEAHYHDCLNDGGQFIERKREALKQCNQIPEISSLEPNIFVKGEPLTLILRGEKLHDEMILDFGPGIVVHSIKVDRLRKKAKVEVFVEPMAEETERDVILIYGDYKKTVNRIMVKATPRTGVDFKEKKVADIKKPSKQQPKTIKEAKLEKKKLPVIPLANLANVDLLVSVKTINGIYKGAGATIYARVYNDSNKNAYSFVVGYCFADQIKSKNWPKWLGKKYVKFLGANNSLLVPIPLALPVPESYKGKFIVAVDINNNLDEGKEGEKNNQTKPFGYDSSASPIQPSVGKPVEGLQISAPCYKCVGGFSGKPMPIVFGPTSTIISDPKALALMGDYVSISLLKLNGSEMVTIAGNAGFNKNSMKNHWAWLVPNIISNEQFFIYMETSDQRYFGKSVPFSIQPPAEGIEKKTETALKEPIKQETKDKFYKKGFPPPGAKDLATNFSIKSSKSFFNSDGVLYKIVLYVNIDANQSFVLGDPKGSKVSWLTLKPYAVVDVNLITGQKCKYSNTEYSQLWSDKNSFYSESGNLILDYPKKVIPQGKSMAMFTLKLKPFTYGPRVEIWEGKTIIKTGATKLIHNLKLFPTYKVKMKFKAWKPDSAQYIDYSWVGSNKGLWTFTYALDTGKKEIKTGVPVKKNVVFNPNCGN
jgi:hypothetical protein